tara:strand:- start:6839 stop:7288 length:450 start_codon:yes stop_codon:yes gene_type:complete
MNNDDQDKILANIEKNGCHIFHVDAFLPAPSFTYSLGIEQTAKMPEIIVTGMDKDTAHFLINEYVNRIKDGERFEADGRYDDFLEDFQITFRVVDKKYYDQYFPELLQFHKGNDFNVLHLIWPDIEGEWPWEKKASKEYRQLMPPLYVR